MDSRIYLDHAGTTPMFPEVIDFMADYMRNCFGNPSSLHSFGVEAKEHLDIARRQVASLVEATPAEITFTSGGTEADNLVIFGAAELAEAQGKKHLITSAVEHHAVLEACEELEHLGFDLTVLPVDKYGMVHPETLRAALRDDTFLVTIMHANNEVGTINPIKELAAITHERGALFHTDAVQTVGKIYCSVRDLDVDMMSFSSHKINGPKGVGALYLRKGIKVKRRAWGGGQERRLRSGTENMPGIVGFGLAAELTSQRWVDAATEWKRLRDLFIEETMRRIPDVILNGHPVQRLPHNSNFCFRYLEGEALLDYLDMNGIACSAGSACNSKDATPSHVLSAMGLSDDDVHSSLRFSFGYGITEEQVRYVVDVLEEKVALLRKMNPFYNS